MQAQGRQLGSRRPRLVRVWMRASGLPGRLHKGHRVFGLGVDHHEEQRRLTSFAHPHHHESVTPILCSSILVLASSFSSWDDAQTRLLRRISFLYFNLECQRFRFASHIHVVVPSLTERKRFPFLPQKNWGLSLSVSCSSSLDWKEA